MQKAFGNLQDTSGNAIASASLTVYDAGTTNAATIYGDDGVTAESNPFTIETTGKWEFYAADGDYDLLFVKSGYENQTFEDLQLFDRASIVTAMQGLTGFDFIQSATPTATAADEWWLDTGDGTIYKSSASGSGSWVSQYQNMLNGVSEDYHFLGNTVFGADITPDGTVHIHAGSAGTVTASTTYNDGVFENSDHVGISFLCPADKNAGVIFGDPDDNDIGSIVYSHSNNSMVFSQNAQNRMELQNTQILFHMTTEDLGFIDAGSAAATEQDWIEVNVAGNQGYIRVYAAK